MTKGSIGKINEKSTAWKRTKTKKIPIVKAKSLTLLTTRALSPLEIAVIRVYQKEINK